MPHPQAGQPVPKDLIPDVDAIIGAYTSVQPDPSEPQQRVSFGTSGHRGRSLDGAFNEAHVKAIAAAIAAVRAEDGISGPLVLAADTHALSQPAFQTTLGVLAAAGVTVHLQPDGRPVPTPVASHAILARNAGGLERADGILLTPSHNPPDDGGLKYNPPHGGPAGSDLTRRIEEAANAWLEAGSDGIVMLDPAAAREAATTHEVDLVGPYVDDLGSVLRLDAVAASGLSVGVDPLGGAATWIWPLIAERYNLNLTVVQDRIDPSFAFMRLDGDGKIRMDCSSPHAMAGLVEHASRFDLAVGNDPDVDRHGIVAGGALMNPNAYLAVAADYLAGHRPDWPAQAGLAKTVVTTRLIDRVAAAHGRPLVETPVGFKWFVDGLTGGRIVFAAEESAGATFNRLDGRVWTTDKDGITAALLAAEITAVTGTNPAERYEALCRQHGRPYAARASAPATLQERTALAQLDASRVTQTALGGDPITAVRTHAPGNEAPIGGLKVETDAGWFAARPSGTEPIYKVYAESFRSGAHASTLLEEAQELVARATAG